MNEIELKQLPRLYERFLKVNGCTDYYVMSAHTFSTFDFLLKSGDTTVVAEYKFRDENLEDFKDTMLEYSKYQPLFVASKMIGSQSGACWYITESKNLILIFDLTERKFNWQQRNHQKNNFGGTEVLKKVTDLDILSADFIISKRDQCYYRIPSGMLKDMFQLKSLNTRLEKAVGDEVLRSLQRNLYEKIKKEFHMIQDQQRIFV